jgi:recombinational DNA repair ATPase RecF
MSSIHTDAIGHLYELAEALAEPWFTMVCDLVVTSRTATIDPCDLDVLIALLAERASRVRSKPATKTALIPATSNSTDLLQSLSGFSNFKLLKSSVSLSLSRRVTVIFGANGSGKSSLCEALKALASPEAPDRPLQNMRASGRAAPRFSYKFRSDASAQFWTQASGFGTRTSTVKYFDTGIAHKYVKAAVSPGNVVSLVPFRLHVFEWTKAFITELRATVLKKQNDNISALKMKLETIRSEFRPFKSFPLASVSEENLEQLAQQIKTGEEFAHCEVLEEKRSAACEMEKATSEEGMKLLRAELREMDSFLRSTKATLGQAERLWEIGPVSQARILTEKQAAQEALAMTLSPDSGSLGALLSLLRASKPLCNLQNAANETCPFCKRKLSDTEVRLFRSYHDLLTGQLEEEIKGLLNKLSEAAALEKAIGATNLTDWQGSTLIPKEMLDDARRGLDLIIANCSLAKEPTADARAAVASVRSHCAKGDQMLEQKSKAMSAAAIGREQQLRDLEVVRKEVEAMDYVHAISQRLELLREAQSLAAEIAFWDVKLQSFPSVLRKITDAAKGAHEQLVLSDFEARLESEYRALTERPMTAFGVTLERRGADAAVTVQPKVGAKDIDKVLSEGERRVHALALFFAELETCPQSVLVFDDPVSSFDYNYVTNYCIRLRDFVGKYIDRQIIVLTHNWHFFVELQTTFNRSGLGGHMDVQVLENCAVVRDYSERIDELKTDVTSILGAPGALTTNETEELAGKMRRLIEAIVNAHVFNNQRHQYRQKGQPVSEFGHFTKLTPLLPTEATSFRDLFGRLSVAEHDDPRNAYVNIDKTTFQTLFDRITEIEGNILARR